MGKLNVPLRTSGRFSERLTNPVGGNERSGAFNEFPLGPSANGRNFFEYFNDFTSVRDFDNDTFVWNRFDGSASAYGANTAKTKVPDWFIALIGAASVTTGSAALVDVLNSATLLTDTPYGVLKVLAGGTDSTGSQVSRAPSGGNVATLLPIFSILNTALYGTTEGKFYPNRTAAFGCRINVGENGTATQSAIAVSLCRDEQNVLSSAGALNSAVASFGFFKPLGSNVLQGFSRLSANATVSLGTPGTIVPGTGGAQGTFIDLALTVQKHSTTVVTYDYYVNGAYVTSQATTASTQVPTDDTYAPSFTVVNGVGCDADLYVDYFWMLSERI